MLHSCADHAQQPHKELLHAEVIGLRIKLRVRESSSGRLARRGKPSLACAARTVISHRPASRANDRLVTTTLFYFGSQRIRHSRDLSHSRVAHNGAHSAEIPRGTSAASLTPDLSLGDISVTRKPCPATQTRHREGPILRLQDPGAQRVQAIFAVACGSRRCVAARSLSLAKTLHSHAIDARQSGTELSAKSICQHPS